MSNPYAPPPSGPRGSAPSGATPLGGSPEQGGASGAPGSGSGAPGSGPGPGGPHQQLPAGAPTTPPGPEPDPAKAAAATRQVLHFGLVMFATMLATFLGLPGQVAALVLAVAAVVLGIRALIAVRRAGMRGRLVAMLAIGVLFAGLMVPLLITMLAVWPVTLEHRQCLQDALTISARDRCDAEYDDALRERLRPPAQTEP